MDDILATLLFVIILDYVLWTSLIKHLDPGFTLSQKQWTPYAEKRLTDINYLDDLAITSDTISNATALLHHLENIANDASET